MSRPRHPDKHIEQAVQYAEALGWHLDKAGPRAHAWGRLFCPHSTREGCHIGVYSTPTNPENHARQLRRYVDLCPHGSNDTTDTGEGDEQGT